jgi:hypothetical protein
LGADLHGSEAMDVVMLAAFFLKGSTSDIDSVDVIEVVVESVA